MNGNVIGLFLYYWVFIIGALFALKMLGLNDSSQIIPILAVTTVFYFAFQYIRERAKQRKEK